MFVDDTFALKGGTAINLFIRDMPRLSVDLDLAFPDHTFPRDLFDVKQLLDNEGITADIRRAFVVYLACHNRPVHEVLFPQLKNIEPDYLHNFVGMTTAPVSLETLLATRDQMISELQAGLDDNERQFLLSLVAAEPDWSLLGIAHLEHLPAIRWKLHNLTQLKKTNAKKFAEQEDELAFKLATVAPTSRV